MSIFTSVALGWLGRRIPDVGGWVFGVVSMLFGLYNSMPPELQAVVLKAIQGNWAGIAITAVPGFLVWGYGQFMSYRATTRPQVVTSEGKRVDMDKLEPAAQQTVNATVKAAPKTILDALIDKLNKTR